MELNNRVTQLEDEIKILKSEIQAVLLDMRENLLNRENPFTLSPPVSGRPIAINNQLPSLNGGEPDVILQEEKPEKAPYVIDEPQAGPEATEPPKPVSEAGPPKKRGTTAHEQLTAKEVAREWRPAAEPEAGVGRKEAPDSPNGKLELTVLVGLTQWVETTVTRLGPGRTQAILEVSEVIGHMSPDLKNILVKLIHPDHAAPGKKIIPRDYLKSLMELSNLLGKDSRPDSLFYPLYALCLQPEGDGDG